jgi:lysophospholipase
MARQLPGEFYPTADNPCPAGGAAFFLELNPALKIRIAYWPGGARGTVFVLPGRSECIEKYFETWGELRTRGFSVAAIDWRGQGASSRLLPNPLKGHVGDFAEYLADFSALLSALEAEAPKPYLLLAHSMGANIAMRVLGEWPRFQGALFTSPMLGLVQSGPVVAALAAIWRPEAFVPGGAKFDPYTEAFASNPVTRDERRFRRNLAIIQTHRALALGGATGGWVKAALRSNQLIGRQSFLARIKVPVVILTAAKEKIVSNSAQARAAKQLAQGSQIVIADGYHELLQERDPIRTQVWRAFDSMVDRVVRRPG